MTTFTIPWPHDGARQLQVVVDQDLPAYGPLEKRIRSEATMTSSHSGLRFMLEVQLGANWNVTVAATSEGVTAVDLGRKRQ